MNVLIVDDDRFVVASLENGIHWKELGFDHIYTAYNITDAKNYLINTPIHLLLSDIDMPYGNGLELLTWIREQKNELPVIFLTNYADFEYAQQALALKSFHYFLKPIEFESLTKIIKDAIRQITLHANHLDRICEHFWDSFLHNEILDTSDALLEHFSKMHLPYKPDDYFVPVFFYLNTYTLSKTNSLHYYFDDACSQFQYLKTSFFANFSDCVSTNDIFLEYDSNRNYYLAILRCDSDFSFMPSLRMDCERFISLITDHIGCRMNCFIGLPTQITGFHSSFQQLRSMIANTLNSSNQVLLLSAYRPAAEVFPALNTEVLEVHLQDGNENAFLDYCHKYLCQLSKNGQLSAVSLSSFQVDTVQILYAYLKRKGVLAHKLFHDNTYHLLSVHARSSVYDMMLYLRYMISTASDYLSFSSSEKSVANLIMEYIEAHYFEDINRSCLADILYLDPDYASKLFKKETGISFNTCLIQKRIAVAKQLLADTSLPINHISDKVGYGNYSYFIRLFKKETGQTPIEYRKGVL